MDTNETKQLQIPNNTKIAKNTKKSNDVKFHVVYRLDFAVKLKEKGYVEVFTKPNPQKPHLKCWYFVESEPFLTDLQKLMEGSKNGGREN